MINSCKTLFSFSLLKDGPHQSYPMHYIHPIKLELLLVILGVIVAYVFRPSILLSYGAMALTHNRVHDSSPVDCWMLQLGCSKLSNQKLFLFALDRWGNTELFLDKRTRTPKKSILLRSPNRLIVALNTRKSIKECLPLLPFATELRLKLEGSRARPIFSNASRARIARAITSWATQVLDRNLFEWKKLIVIVRIKTEKQMNPLFVHL